MAAGAIYGSGFLTLRPDLTGFGTELNAKMKGAGLAGALGKVGKVAGLAFVGAAGAAIGAGIKGVVDFAGFERQMNEVFTLLPGISEQAMGEMQEDVQEFSREFGTLPNEVVPALYQSLSAGVPQDNVFAFMETAQKAALGGVTDLETAVDGISSVTNAYGDDVISATEASDLMFTAVRKGKTTFDEMSQSLFNVIPTAAGLGVEFGDVTAALATMTAQGTPTSVATTQLRQLFVELSKEGGVAAKAFEDISGKSFQEFIAEGGNVAEALAVMQDAAGESGVQIQDMFGSVEAGSAALSLTGSDAFTENLAEMGNSAGATEAAFQQMDQGLGRSWDKIKAAVSNALLDIGQRLAPFVAQFSGFLEDNLPRWIDTASRAFDSLGQWWTQNSPAIIGFVKQVFGGIQQGIQLATPWVERIVSFLRDNFKPVLAAVATIIAASLVPTITGLVATIGAALSPFVLVAAAIAGFVAILVKAYNESETFRNIVQGAWQSIRTAAAKVWPKIQAIISGVMEVIRTVITTVTKIIRAVWEQHGERIMAVVKAAFTFIKDTISAVLRVVQGIIDTVMGVLTGDWSRAWEGIRNILGGVWDRIKATVRLALDVLKNIIPIALDAIQEVFERIWDTVAGVVSAAWDDITDFVSDGIDNVLEFFSELPGNILEALGDLGGLLVDVAGDLIGGMVEGIKNTAGRVIQAIKDYVLDKVPDFVKNFFGISSPSKMFEEFGRSLPEGLAVGIGDASGMVDRAVTRLTRGVPRTLSTSIPSDLATPLGAHPLIGVANFNGTPEQMLDDFERRQQRAYRMAT